MRTGYNLDMNLIKSAENKKLLSIVIGLLQSVQCCMHGIDQSDKSLKIIHISFPDMAENDRLPGGREILYMIDQFLH